MIDYVHQNLGYAMMTQEFWTTKQLTIRWQIAEGTLRRWIREGRLSAVKVGRQLRFAESEIDRFEATFSAKGKVKTGLDGGE